MKLTLDLEPEDDPFQDLAIILFHTSAPNYTFVDDLNHLYHFRLARKEDMELYSCNHPLFSYHDPLRHLTYHLIERPAHPLPANAPLATLWSPTHKLLLIQGEDAQRQADLIVGEFSVLPPTPPADDIAATTRHQILSNFHATFTPVSTLHPGAELSPTASRKARREHADLQQLVTSILQYFDLHHSTL